MVTLAEDLIQATEIASDKYAPDEDRQAAVRKLATFFYAIKRELRYAAIQEYFDRCNTILSQCTRQFASDHFMSRIHHETEQTLEQWLVGAVIGTIEDTFVIVTLYGKRIKLMDYRIATMMRVHSLGYSFTLRCDLDKKEVIINSVCMRPKYI